MKFKYYSRINSTKILEEMKQLLRLCDKEFIPPLSSRASTTQSDLLSVSEETDGIESYFSNIAKQAAIVALDGGKVIALMSFKQDYVCEHISKAFSSNLYVTTVIVHPEYRHKSIAGHMYDALIKRFPKLYIFLREPGRAIYHISEFCCPADFMSIVF